MAGLKEVIEHKGVFCALDSDRGSHFWLTPKAGGISIHHCLMLHASPNNLSGRPRRGVVYEYRAGDAYQLAGTIFADTGLQIAGTNRGVARCDAGLLQLPRRRPQAGDPDTTPFGSAYNQSGSHALTDN